MYWWNSSKQWHKVPRIALRSKTSMGSSYKKQETKSMPDLNYFSASLTKNELNDITWRQKVFCCNYLVRSIAISWWFGWFGSFGFILVCQLQKLLRVFSPCVLISKSSWNNKKDKFNQLLTNIIYINLFNSIE